MVVPSILQYKPIIITMMPYSYKVFEKCFGAVWELLVAVGGLFGRAG